MANWWSQSLEKSATKLSLQSSVAVHRHLMGARSAGHAVSCKFFEFGFVHVEKFGEHARGCSPSCGGGVISAGDSEITGQPSVLKVP